MFALLYYLWNWLVVDEYCYTLKRESDKLRSISYPFKTSYENQRPPWQLSKIPHLLQPQPVLLQTRPEISFNTGRTGSLTTLSTPKSTRKETWD